MPQQAQPRQEGIISRALSAVVFWWLAAMGAATLSLAAMIPSWLEYRQVVQVREHLEHQVAGLEKKVERNDYYIKAYTEDPEAINMLAVTDLRFRRPDEVVMPLPRQVLGHVKPVGWTTETRAAPVPARPSPAATPAAPASTNSVEQYVNRAKQLSRDYLGPARSIALVDIFTDPTCRKALTIGALAVLAAALFLCRAPAPRKEP